MPPSIFSNFHFLFGIDWICVRVHLTFNPIDPSTIHTYCHLKLWAFTQMRWENIFLCEICFNICLRIWYFKRNCCYFGWVSVHCLQHARIFQCSKRKVVKHFNFGLSFEKWIKAFQSKPNETLMKLEEIEKTRESRKKLKIDWTFSLINGIVSNVSNALLM